MLDRSGTARNMYVCLSLTRRVCWRWVSSYEVVRSLCLCLQNHCISRPRNVPAKPGFSDGFTDRYNTVRMLQKWPYTCTTGTR